MLRRHRWPGNVRELENLIRRLAVLHSGDTIPAAAIAGGIERAGAQLSAEDEARRRSRCRGSVERYLTHYFLAQGDKLPPPGIYDRILQEVERPLISICLAATRATRSAPPSFWA